MLVSLKKTLSAADVRFTERGSGGVSQLLRKKLIECET